MSNWNKATLAAKSAVSEPIKQTRVSTHPGNRGAVRNNRNTPATTMVELCKRAETGVGPSMAEGSQACRPNWALFPIAARVIPSAMALLRVVFEPSIKSSFIFQVL